MAPVSFEAANLCTFRDIKQIFFGVFVIFMEYKLSLPLKLNDLT